MIKFTLEWLPGSSLVYERYIWNLEGGILFIRALLEEILMPETADSSTVGALRGAWAPVAEWEFIVHVRFPLIPGSQGWRLGWERIC